jgi:hypothetical protein
MPSAMDHTSEVHPGDQVSNIQTFLQSCVKLFKDPSSVTILQNMLDRCNTNTEGKLEHRKQSITSMPEGGQAENLD